MVFDDDSHDKLGLAEDPVNQAIRNNEDVFFSDFAAKANRHGVKQKRGVMVTNKALYLFRPGTYNVVQRRNPLSQVSEIWTSTDSLTLVVRIRAQSDMQLTLYTLESRQALVDSFRSYVDIDGKLTLTVVRQVTDLMVATDTVRDPKLLVKPGKWLCAWDGALVTRDTGNYVQSYNGRHFHQDCFRCMTCERQIQDGETYYPGKSGMPLCEAHGEDYLSSNSTIYNKLGGKFFRNRVKKYRSHECVVLSGMLLRESDLLPKTSTVVPATPAALMRTPALGMSKDFDDSVSRGSGGAPLNLSDGDSFQADVSPKKDIKKSSSDDLFGDYKKDLEQPFQPTPDEPTF